MGLGMDGSKARIGATSTACVTISRFTGLVKRAVTSPIPIQCVSRSFDVSKEKPGGVETGRFRALIQSVADGWNILTTRRDPAGGPDLRGAFVVRVSHRLTAIAVVQRKMPDAMVQIDSETAPEVFWKIRRQAGRGRCLGRQMTHPNAPGTSTSSPTKSGRGSELAPGR
jgi:hypothetical protein